MRRNKGCGPNKDKEIKKQSNLFGDISFKCEPSIILTDSIPTFYVVLVVGFFSQVNFKASLTD